MAYQIHIIPRKDLQTEESWKQAVRECEGVRLSEAESHTIVNPVTGAKMTMGGSTTDVEIYFPEEDAWHCALLWRRGRGSINARFELGDAADPAWRAVSWLAQRLDARIQGDEGEIYDAVSQPSHSTGVTVREP
jgi:hypothetical protein